MELSGLHWTAFKGAAFARVGRLLAPHSWFFVGDKETLLQVGCVKDGVSTRLSPPRAARDSDLRELCVRVKRDKPSRGLGWSVNWSDK